MPFRAGAVDERRAVWRDLGGLDDRPKRAFSDGGSVEPIGTQATTTRRPRELGGSVARAGRSEQRERILDALFAVMSSSGTLGASVTEIAEAAGIARGGLHYYFESKDELKEALMRRLGDRYLERLSDVVARVETRTRAGLALHPGGAVAALCRWHFTGDEDEASRLLAVWIDYWGQAPSHDGIGGVVFTVQEAARALCARAVVFDHPAAAFDDERRRLVGGVVLGVIEGGLLQWRIAAHAERPLDRVRFGEAISTAAVAAVSALIPPATDSVAAVEVR
jgi:AcrR family transcriptional regulator